ncbi:MAG: Gfo/Idh/MocA family oxidoreductase [Planctomycetes bacterium]|nr:Gfo/Idh/MocA family oxidoreductase [Planctomycetota bacterium]
MNPGKIRFGIIGAVGRGSGYVRALSVHPSTEVVALCDIQEEGLKRLGAEIGISHLFTDVEKMLDSGLVNAVVVGTPMPLHVRQSILALDRGIHVLCEVPAGVSMEECHDLVGAVRRSRAKYMMGENYCYIPTNVLVREIARAGLFGQLYFGEGEYIHELKDLNEVTVWRRRWQTGINGNTYPTHSLGPVLQWFGNQRVVAVCSLGTGHHYTDPRGRAYENEDSTFTFCRLSGGGLVNLRLDMLSNRPHNLTYYSLQGTDGCYEAARGLGDQPKIWLKSRSQRVEWKPLKDFEQEFLPSHWLNPPEDARKAGHWGGDYWEVQDFVSAILEDRDPPIGIHQAMDMTLPGLASQMSIVQGSNWVAVPDSRCW